MPPKPKEKATEIQILAINKGRIEFNVLGTSPLILNRMSEKAKQQLLMPPARKTAADKASSLKHDPIAEFRSSPYIDRDPKGATFLQFMSSAFKRALRDTALDMPGVNKSQMGRLMWVEGEYISIYGVPKLLMSVTRSADINKTPDIRTRAVVPEWCCKIRVSYVTPLLKEQSIINLMGAAGVMQGIGDWRTGKGSGTFGTFEVVTANDKRFAQIMKAGSRKEQESAMRNPDFYDHETEELFTWFLVESKRRGFKVVGGGEE